MNRMLFVECDAQNCSLGSACANRRFTQKAQPPGLQLVGTESKGNGVVCCHDITAGTFICEYVGEVMSVESADRRMVEYHDEGVTAYYQMQLDGHEIVDAGKKGNIARFINHSCGPNMATEKWTVRGESCVGLFALRDVPAFTELCYDYKFSSHQNSKQPCYCGASNCRGFLGAKPVEDSAGNASATPQKKSGGGKVKAKGAAKGKVGAGKA